MDYITIYEDYSFDTYHIGMYESGKLVFQGDPVAFLEHFPVGRVNITIYHTTGLTDKMFTYPDDEHDLITTINKLGINLERK